MRVESEYKRGKEKEKTEKGKDKKAWERIGDMGVG